MNTTSTWNMIPAYDVTPGFRVLVHGSTALVESVTVVSPGRLRVELNDGRTMLVVAEAKFCVDPATL